MIEGSRPSRRRWLADFARRFRDSEAGSTIVEFGLGAIILLSLLLGIVEVGRAGFTQAYLYYIAEETTRWAIVNPTKTDAEIKQYALDRSFIDVTVTPHVPSEFTGTKTINVTVNHTFNWIVPWVAGGITEFESSSKGFVAEEDL